MYQTYTYPDFRVACNCVGICISCQAQKARKNFSATQSIAVSQYPSLQEQAPRPESRIFELQTKAQLSPGEKIELEMLLKKKWG